MKKEISVDAMLQRAALLHKCKIVINKIVPDDYDVTKTNTDIEYYIRTLETNLASLYDADKYNRKEYYGN